MATCAPDLPRREAVVEEALEVAHVVAAHVRRVQREGPAGGGGSGHTLLRAAAPELIPASFATIQHGGEAADGLGQPLRGLGGERQPQERPRRLGGEERAAGRDDHARGGGAQRELAIVGARRERDPEVHAALAADRARRAAARRARRRARRGARAARGAAGAGARARPACRRAPAPPPAAARRRRGPRRSARRAGGRAAGPRATTAPIRRPGAAGLVSERTWTTWPSGSSPNSGGGARRRSARSRNASSSIRNAPAARTASSTSARRSTASVAPCGFANTGCR